jgi:ABC-type Fe3+-hydroxamate transport system substrate-binding protein
MPVRFFTRWISLPALISGLLVNAPAIAVAQSTAYQTVMVTDDSGAQTSFAAPPQRIVSLNTGHTETVFPGHTILPVASIVRAACAPGSLSTATTRSASMATSAGYAGLPVPSASQPC